VISDLFIPNLSMAAGGGSLGWTGVLVLLALLVQKELALACGTRRLRDYARLLDVAILPLLLAFLMMVVERVIRALN
jgi:hypothetical protein